MDVWTKNAIFARRNQHPENGKAQRTRKMGRIACRAIPQNLLVIIEGKTRQDDKLAEPEAAVNPQKIRNLGIAANEYIKEFALDYEIRFDILTIVGTEEAGARIEHIENAFNPLLL